MLHNRTFYYQHKYLIDILKLNGKDLIKTHKHLLYSKYFHFLVYDLLIL